MIEILLFSYYYVNKYPKNKLDVPTSSGSDLSLYTDPNPPKTPDRERQSLSYSYYTFYAKIIE